MGNQKKQWFGLAAAGTAIATFVTRLRRRANRSEKAAVASDIRS
jgi:cytochrome oxidase assembly protein ShyY1